MKLLTKPILEKLIKNFEANKERRENTIDFKPVVKFFGGSSATWLISEYDQENDEFFGLCDPGLGFPELGYVSKAELFSVKFPPFGLGVERDRHFKADKTLNEYTEIAKIKRRIIA